MSAEETATVVDALQDLAKDADARRVFEALSKRVQDGADTTVDALKKSSRLEYTVVSSVLKQIAAVGAADFKVGRHGRSTRVEWWYSAESVGKAGLGEGDLEPYFEYVEPDAKDAVDDAGQQMARHSFTIRPGLVISVELPIDLTEKEADRLAGMIRLSAFGD